MIAFFKNKDIIKVTFVKCLDTIAMKIFSLKFELMRIFLNCFSLTGYIIECPNRHTILENPPDTPQLDLKSAYTYIHIHIHTHTHTHTHIYIFIFMYI